MLCPAWYAYGRGGESWYPRSLGILTRTGEGGVGSGEGEMEIMCRFLAFLLYREEFGIRRGLVLTLVGPWLDRPMVHHSKAWPSWLVFPSPSEKQTVQTMRCLKTDEDRIDSNLTLLISDSLCPKKVPYSTTDKHLDVRSRHQDAG